MRPSELAGIGCEWCAYCFDEALFARDRARERRAADEHEQERERMRLTQMRRSGG